MVILMVILLSIFFIFLGQAEELGKRGQEELEPPLLEGDEVIAESVGISKLIMSSDIDTLTMIRRFFSRFDENYVKNTSIIDDTRERVVFNPFIFDTNGESLIADEIKNEIVQGINEWYLGESVDFISSTSTTTHETDIQCDERILAGHTPGVRHYCRYDEVCEKEANWGLERDIVDNGVCCPQAYSQYIESGICCPDGYIFKNDRKCHRPSGKTNLNIGDINQPITWIFDNDASYDISYSTGCWDANLDDMILFASEQNQGWIYYQQGATYHGKIMIRVSWLLQGNNIYPVITICDNNR